MPSAFALSPGPASARSGRSRAHLPSCARRLSSRIARPALKPIFQDAIVRPYVELGHRPCVPPAVRRAVRHKQARSAPQETGRRPNGARAAAVILCCRFTRLTSSARAGYLRGDGPRLRLPSYASASGARVEIRVWSRCGLRERLDPAAVSLGPGEVSVHALGVAQCEHGSTAIVRRISWRDLQGDVQHPPPPA
jgi:hypothetical protein